MQQPYNNHSFLPLNVLNYSRLLHSFTPSLLHSFTPHRYRREVATRRKLHEKCMELEGNIRVFCRSRPVLPVDGTDAESNKVVVACTANGKKLLSVESFAVWILLSVESFAVWILFIVFCSLDLVYRWSLDLVIGGVWILLSVELQFGSLMFGASV